VKTHELTLRFRLGNSGEAEQAEESVPND